jgi:predicted TIM-barrel fold metal-dependent hydrolase
MTTPVKSARELDSAAQAAMAKAKLPSMVISADGHACEPVELWKQLPAKIQEKMPKFHGRNKRPDGGYNPTIRLTDMDADHITAEVLYPDTGLNLFRGEADVQEATFRLYNDWLADYCKTSPKRLFGIPAISVYNIDNAIKELQRTHDLGLRGALIWGVPHPDLPFDSPHYDRFWAAAAELDAPVNLHVLTGFNYSQFRQNDPTKRIHEQTNVKINETNDSLFTFIWSGIFDRFPKLKMVIVESEIGWMPFLLQQWDYYFSRNRNEGKNMGEYKINRLPSEIARDHVFATFMDDYVGSRQLSFWGEKNCMWSSDYPHGNMTFPNSMAFVARQVGDLPADTQKRLLSQNVIDLYGLKV